MRRMVRNAASAARAWGGPGVLRALRDHAALNRGLWLVAPVFWAAFTVFLHPAWGAAGFLIHAFSCLPRGVAARVILLASFPLLALWFALREPFLTLPDIPGHRTFRADEPSAEGVARTGVVMGAPVPTPLGYTFPFREEGRRGLLYRATVGTEKPPRWGATLTLSGHAASGEAPPNPGQLDMRRVLRGQGASAALRAVSWREIRPPPAWVRALAAARGALQASLDRNVPAAARPLLEAALLNRTTGVPFDTQEAFFRSGMQHILAISGQHIGMLIAFTLFLALRIRLPRKAAFLVAAALAAAYIPLVGAPVSVVRSGIMLACLLPGILLERPCPAPHALCLTASVDLLLDPHNILNLGFQLSYAATLALILAAKPAQAAARRALEKLPRGAGFPGAAAAAQMTILSAVIALFTYPVLAASTHATTPWGVPANVAAVPLGAGMLLGGLCTWSLDFMLPAPLDVAAAWAGAATGLCALLLEGCVFLFAGLPGALRPIADPSPAGVAGLATGCAAVVILLRLGHFRAAVLCAALGIAAEALRPALARPWPGTARVTFLAVGHGDAAVLELPGAVILVDAGDSPRVARHIIAPFLRHRGISRLDALLITHPDRDHYGGASALLDGIPVGMVLGPPEPEDPSPTWRCLREKARERRTPWKEGRAGERVYAGKGISLRILAPDPSLLAADGGDKNDRSLVALLDTRRERVLFTGDVEQPGQRALAATWPVWRGAWLKAPHHGSDRTTAPCFLTAAAPPRTVISCGGRRGFPGAATMTTLAGIGSAIAVTARDGAVTWNFGRRVTRETRHLGENPGVVSDGKSAPN
jgi:competence protein ComEC